jgi:hypothetical protein
MLTPRAGDGREPRRAGVPNPASPRAAASPPARAEWRRGTQPHRPPSSKQAHRKPARQRPSQISARGHPGRRDGLAGTRNVPAARALPARCPLIPLQQWRPKVEARNLRPVVDHIRRASLLRTEQEQTSASRVSPATPHLDRANKGASRRYPSSTTSDGPSFFAASPPDRQLHYR